MDDTLNMDGRHHTVESLKVPTHMEVWESKGQTEEAHAQLPWDHALHLPAAPA